MKVQTKESRMKAGNVGGQRKGVGDIGLTEEGMVEKEEECGGSRDKRK